jgi:hypothetical protein
MWEISEIPHCAELKALERAEQIERGRESKAEKVRNFSAPIAGGSQPMLTAQIPRCPRAVSAVERYLGK